jgi:hypothetical protein
MGFEDDFFFSEDINDYQYNSAGSFFEKNFFKNFLSYYTDNLLESFSDSFSNFLTKFSSNQIKLGVAPINSAIFSRLDASLDLNTELFLFFFNNIDCADIEEKSIFGANYWGFKQKKYKYREQLLFSRNYLVDFENDLFETIQRLFLSISKEYCLYPEKFVRLSRPKAINPFLSFLFKVSLFPERTDHLPILANIFVDYYDMLTFEEFNNKTDKTLNENLSKVEVGYTNDLSKVNTELSYQNSSTNNPDFSFFYNFNYRACINHFVCSYPNIYVQKFLSDFFGDYSYFIFPVKEIISYDLLNILYISYIIIISFVCYIFVSFINFVFMDGVLSIDFFYYSFLKRLIISLGSYNYIFYLIIEPIYS